MLLFLSLVKKLRVYDSKSLESQVENCLMTAGFEKTEHKDSLDNADKWYIHQPNGTQQPPDFLISCYGVIFVIECKSSKNGSPKWNGGSVEQNTIYIYADTIKGDITFFLGSSVTTQEVEDAINLAYEKAQKQFAEDTKHIRDMNGNHHRRYPTLRPDNQTTHRLLSKSDEVEKQEKAVIEYVESFNRKLQRTG